MEESSNEVTVPLKEEITSAEAIETPQPDNQDASPPAIQTEPETPNPIEKPELAEETPNVHESQANPPIEVHEEVAEEEVPREALPNPSAVKTSLPKPIITITDSNLKERTPTVSGKATAKKAPKEVVEVPKVSKSESKLLEKKRRHENDVRAAVRVLGNFLKNKMKRHYKECLGSIRSMVRGMEDKRKKKQKTTIKRKPFLIIEKIIHGKGKKLLHQIWPVLQAANTRIYELIDLKLYKNKLFLGHLDGLVKRLQVKQFFSCLPKVEKEETFSPAKTNEQGNCVGVLDRIFISVLGFKESPKVNKFFFLSIWLKYFVDRYRLNRGGEMIDKLSCILYNKKNINQSVKDFAAKLQVMFIMRHLRAFRAIQEYPQVVRLEQVIEGLDMYAYLVSTRFVKPVLSKWAAVLQDTKKREKKRAEDISRHLHLLLQIFGQKRFTQERLAFEDVNNFAKLKGKKSQKEPKQSGSIQKPNPRKTQGGDKLARQSQTYKGEQILIPAENIDFVMKPKTKGKDTQQSLQKDQLKSSQKAPAKMHALPGTDEAKKTSTLPKQSSPPRKAPKIENPTINSLRTSSISAKPLRVKSKTPTNTSKQNYAFGHTVKTPTQTSKQTPKNFKKPELIPEKKSNVKSSQFETSSVDTQPGVKKVNLQYVNSPGTDLDQGSNDERRENSVRRTEHQTHGDYMEMDRFISEQRREHPMDKASQNAISFDNIGQKQRGSEQEESHDVGSRAESNPSHQGIRLILTAELVKEINSKFYKGERDMEAREEWVERLSEVDLDLARPQAAVGDRHKDKGNVIQPNNNKENPHKTVSPLVSTTLKHTPDGNKDFRRKQPSKSPKRTPIRIVDPPTPKIPIKETPKSKDDIVFITENLPLNPQIPERSNTPDLNRIVVDLEPILEPRDITPIISVEEPTPKPEIKEKVSKPSNPSKQAPLNLRGTQVFKCCRNSFVLDNLLNSKGTGSKGLEEEGKKRAGKETKNEGKTRKDDINDKRSHSRLTRIPSPNRSGPQPPPAAPGSNHK
jgi:hypothetical protein